MSEIDDKQQNRHWRWIVWTLRVTVALQCVGNWWWMTQIEETPLLHWMLDPHDVGGLAWTEATSLVVQQVVGWLVLVAGGLVLWRPHAVLLVPLLLVQLLITVAMWRVAEGYPLQAAWLPAQMLMLFPFATQLVRVVAPLALLMTHQLAPNDIDNTKRIDRAMQMLRYSAAIVFLAHGIEAWQLNPKFVDLIINSAQRTFGWSVSESTAEAFLAGIGGVDIAISIACLGVRSRTLMSWMAFWGLATAVSRLTANGWVMSWHETLTRTPHFGIPLAVALWWHLLKYNSANIEVEQASSGSEQSDSATI